MFSWFLCCILYHSFHCSMYGSQVTEILDHFDFCTLAPQYSRVFPAVTDHIILHFAAFMRRPTYSDIFSSSSDNFACLSVKSRWGLYHSRNLSRIVTYHMSRPTPALRYNFPVLFQYPVQHYRKLKRWLGTVLTYACEPVTISNHSPLMPFIFRLLLLPVSLYKFWMMVTIPSGIPYCRRIQDCPQWWSMYAVDCRRLSWSRWNLPSLVFATLSLFQ